MSDPSSSAALALFNAEGRCPKCMGEVASAFEAAPGYSTLRYNGEPIGQSHPLFVVTRGEHIRRWCKTCRYEWPEACLDS